MPGSMDEVARHAGVSKSTVSLVLNNRPGTSAEMRRRVLDAVAAVGYTLPEQRAQRESTSLTHAPVIALVHCVDEEPDVDAGLTHLYLSYRNGIQRFTQGRDISVMLVTSYRDGNEDSLSYQLLAQEERALDGLILMGPGLHRNTTLIQRVLDRQIPAVILGRSWPELPISSVSQDHTEQAQLILDHLLALAEKMDMGAVYSEGGNTELDWCKRAYESSDCVKDMSWRKFLKKGYFVVPSDPATARAPTANRWFYEGRKKDTPELIWGDQSVPYGEVVTVMVALQEADVPSVGLVTENPK